MKRFGGLMKGLLIAIIICCLLTVCCSVSLAEAKASGLDIIIVMDFSTSTMLGDNANDPDCMSLDAAAMLINMCDAKLSRVAFVPFTDNSHEKLQQDYIARQGNQWRTWIDVSDRAKRKALCDSLYDDEVLKLGEAYLHNGKTDYSYGLKIARELIQNRETQNQVMVLVLGDGVNSSDSKSEKNARVERSLAEADLIKSNGGIIYCMQFGSNKEGTKLYDQIATDEAKHWTNVDPAQLKSLYSDVFAELIGTEQVKIEASGEVSGKATFEIPILHKAVAEVNVVLDRANIDGSTVVLEDPDGNTVEEGEHLIRYVGSGSEKKGYDFVSLKMIDPTPGTWKVLADKTTDVDSLNIDLLYNYTIDLTASAADANGQSSYVKNDNIKFVSYFINENGEPSDDMTLYDALDAQKGTGIKADLTVYDADGNEVYRQSMERDNQAGNYYLNVVPTEAGFAKDSNENQNFTYKVHAEGDHLIREAAGNFVLLGTGPQARVSTPIDMGTICTDDILNTGMAQEQLKSSDLNDYFTDTDGDALTFHIKDKANVNAEITDNCLIITQIAGNGNVADGTVTVYATDTTGTESPTVTFTAKVVSIKELVQSCVKFTAKYNAETPVELNKGTSLTVTLEPDITSDSNEFPYTELRNLVKRETVLANAVYTNEASGLKDDMKFTETENHSSYTLTAGSTIGTVTVNSKVTVGGEEIAVEPVTVEVINRNPTCTKETEDLGTLKIEDIYSDEAEMIKTEALEDCFTDEDNDKLAFSITAEDGVKGEITEENGKHYLSITPSGSDSIEKASVSVTASDGDDTSDPCVFSLSVLNMRALTENNVTFKTDAENTSIELNKGNDVTVNIKFDISESETYPDSQAAEQITDEMLEANTTYTNTIENKPEDSEFTGENNKTYTVKANRKTGEMTVHSTQSIGETVEKDAGTITFKIVNIEPAVAEGLKDLLIANGAQEAAANTDGSVAVNELTFTVDCDKPEDGKQKFDLKNWFTDGDGENDQLTYTVTMENQAEDEGAFSFARKLLRTINLIAKDGDILTADEEGLKNSQLNLEAERYGNTIVTVTATDEDNASVTYSVIYKVSSSKDQLKCIITYAILALLLILILVFLYIKLILHSPWATKDVYSVTLGGFPETTADGKRECRFGYKDRKGRDMATLLTRFTLHGVDSKTTAALRVIWMWPTTGSKLVVMLRKGKKLPAGYTVKVNGTDISGGRSAKWSRHTSIEIVYRDADGNQNTCKVTRP